MSTPHDRITRAAGVNSAATGICRVLGYVRDAVIAAVFGTSFVNSAFSVAFAVPNTLRRLFGEGAMSSSFIPLFAERLHHGGRDNAFDAARLMLTLLAALLSLIGVVVAALALLAAWLLPLDTKTRLTCVLTAVMMPYSVLICLTALCGAILNTLGHFSRPALAPVFLNLSMIAGAWLAARWLPPPMERQIFALAGGVLLGGVLQLAFQVPALRRRGFHFRPRWNLRDQFVNRMITLMGPALIGAGVSQINVLIDRFMALAVNERGASVLSYADRLVELPLGMFGIALATAVLPAMSFCAARDDHAGLVAALGFAIRHVSFIMLPALAGLAVLAEPIVHLLFERGAFTAESTQFTAIALRYYAPGLVAFALIKIIVPTFYALKDTRTPVKIGASVLVINVMLNYVLMRTALREAGLALSTTVCAYLNVTLLLIALRRRCGPLGLRRVARSLVQIALITAITALSVWHVREWCSAAQTLTHRVVAVALPMAAGIAAYALLAFFSRQAEMMELLAAFFRRRSGGQP